MIRLLASALALASVGSSMGTGTWGIASEALAYADTTCADIAGSGVGSYGFGLFGEFLEEPRILDGAAFLLPFLHSDERGHVATRYPQIAFAVGKTEYPIIGENLDALRGNTEQFGGAVGIHRVGWLSRANRFAHLLTDFPAPLGGNIQTGGAPDSRISAQMAARLLRRVIARSEESSTGDTARYSAVALTTPERFAVLILPGKEFDYQASEAAADQRFDARGHGRYPLVDLLARRHLAFQASRIPQSDGFSICRREFRRRANIVLPRSAVPMSHQTADPAFIRRCVCVTRSSVYLTVPPIVIGFNCVQQIFRSLFHCFVLSVLRLGQWPDSLSERLTQVIIYEHDHSVNNYFSEVA